MNDDQSKKPTLPRRGPQNRPGKKPPLPRYKRGPFNYLLIAIVILTVMMILPQLQRVEEIRWDQFVEHIKNKHIDSVIVKDTEVTGQFTEDHLANQQGKTKKYFGVLYNPVVHGEWLGLLLKEAAASHPRTECHPVSHQPCPVSSCKKKIPHKRGPQSI